MKKDYFMKLLIVLICTLSLSMLLGTVEARAVGGEATSEMDCGRERQWFLGFTPWFFGLTRMVTNPDGSRRCAMDSRIISCDEPHEEPRCGLPFFVGVVTMNVLASLGTAVAFAAFGFILYGGFLYVTGQGEPGKLEKAKKAIQNAVIGLIIGLATTTIVNVMFGVLGL